MPLYAYKCNKCEYAFKLFHGIEESPGKCPQCSNDELKKQFPASVNVKTETVKESAKQRIEKYIEETRESIKQQTAEARKDYNP